MRRTLVDVVLVDVGLVAVLLAMGCGSVKNTADAGSGSDADVDAPGDGPIDGPTGPVPLSRQQVAFFSDRGGSQQVWTMRLDGSGTVQITNDAANTALFPSLTPNGARVVFSRNNDIFAVNVAGTMPQQLTNDTTADFRPSYSWDGTRVLWVSERAGTRDIWAMNADGTAPAAVTALSGEETFPQWSPDGTKITFTNFTTNEVMVINVDGSGLINVSNDAGMDGSSAFSPDGTKIVFSSNRSGAYQLYLRSADGTGAATPVTTSGVTNPFHASFDVNGTHLVYYGTATGEQKTRLFITEIATGATAPLTDGAFNDGKTASRIVEIP